MHAELKHEPLIFKIKFTDFGLLFDCVLLHLKFPKSGYQHIEINKKT